MPLAPFSPRGSVCPCTGRITQIAAHQRSHEVRNAVGTLLAVRGFRRMIILDFRPVSVQSREVLRMRTEATTQEIIPPSSSTEKRYEEICTSIRTTDKISFKLLGLVPLLSGDAIAAVLKQEVDQEPVLWLVSIFAAVVTMVSFYGSS